MAISHAISRAFIRIGPRDRLIFSRPHFFSFALGRWWYESLDPPEVSRRFSEVNL